MLRDDLLVTLADILHVGDLDVRRTAVGTETAAHDGHQVPVVEFAVLVEELQRIDQEMVSVGEFLIPENRHDAVRQGQNPLRMQLVADGHQDVYKRQIQHLTEIVEEARKRGKKRLAVAYGQDSHTLEAVYEAYKEGLVEPTLFGDKEVIKQVCQENGIDINAFNIVNEPNDVKCVQQAVASVVSGNADVLMKGLVSTDKYMRGILNKEAGLFPPKGVLSHVSIVEMPCYHKLLIISDVAVIPLPDFKQKMVQIGYLARTANLLGIATPKIACIAPSEQLLPNVISSTEGALLAKMADRGQLGNVVVDGPLSLDVALYKEVAEHKKVKGSSVAGDPDCLLFPNLESANVFFKSVSHLCGGELAAMVMGTKVPCVLTSRGEMCIRDRYCACKPPKDG